MCSKLKNQIIHTAVRKYDISLIKSLMQHGANIMDYHLLAALKRKGLTNTLIGILLEAGGNPNAISYDKDFHADETLLCIAVKEKNGELMELLINAGAAVDMTGAKCETPLVKAVCLNYKRGVRILVNSNANYYVESLRGTVPVIAAVNRRTSGMLRMLLKGGLDVNSGNKLRGLTPLMAIASRNRCRFGMVRTLLKVGANINQVDNSKWTALFHACYHTVTGVILMEDRLLKNWLMKKALLVECLIFAGSNVNHVCERGNTALMILFRRMIFGGYKIAEILLNAGVDVNAKNCKNNTALTIACNKNSFTRDQDIRALIDAGVDVNARNIYNKSAFDYLKAHRLTTNDNTFYTACKYLIYAGAEVDLEMLEEKRKLFSRETFIHGTFDKDEFHTKLNEYCKVRLQMNLKLSYLCREVIRTTVNRNQTNINLFQKVHQLPIPIILKEYVAQPPSQIWMEEYNVDISPYSNNGHTNRFQISYSSDDINNYYYDYCRDALDFEKQDFDDDDVDDDNEDISMLV